MDETINRILLVEDEDAHAELMQRAFAPHSDEYHLTVARTLDEAKDYLVQTIPDLIISDLLLPDGRGTELLADVNGEKKFPFIVITSHGNEAAVVEAMKAGALDYVVKSEATLADMPHIAQGALRQWDHIIQKQQAEEKIRASLEEKEMLLKEIHHRVKNNLQVISSLLRLQERQIHDEEALQFFKDSQNRVLSMALVHEKLYQSEDLSHINLGEYVKSLGRTLFRGHLSQPDKIKLFVDIEGIYLGIDYAVPCGLVINELLTNSIRHAFPESFKGEPTIQILLKNKTENEAELIFQDNGIGLPDTFSFDTVESLGLHLIHILVRDQLQGEVRCNQCQGTCFQITLRNIFT